MRFTAPEHTTGVDLTSGPFVVVDGVLEVADQLLTQGDRSGLSANGFVQIIDPVAAAPAPVVSPPKANPAPGADA